MRSTDADGLADSRRRCRDGFLPVVRGAAAWRPAAGCVDPLVARSSSPACDPSWRGRWPATGGDPRRRTAGARASRVSTRDSRLVQDFRLRRIVPGIIPANQSLYKLEKQSGRELFRLTNPTQTNKASRDVRWGLRRPGGDAQTRGVSSVRFRA
jgi:hypothetical protein